MAINEKSEKFLYWVNDKVTVGSAREGGVWGRIENLGKFGGVWMVGDWEIGKSSMGGIWKE